MDSDGICWQVQASTLQRVHPHEQRFRKKKILVKCRSWTITRLFKVISPATLHGELFEKSLEQIIRAYIYQTRRKQPEKAREYSRLSSLFTAWVIPLAAREERRVYPQARH